MKAWNLLHGFGLVTKNTLDILIQAIDGCSIINLTHYIVNDILPSDNESI